MNTSVHWISGRRPQCSEMPWLRGLVDDLAFQKAWVFSMEAGWKMKSASKYRVLHVYYLELETGQLTFLCLRQHAESETESPEEHLGANGKLHFHTSSFGKPAPAF